MARALPVVLALVAASFAAPASAGATYAFDVVDEADRPKDDFAGGETVVFKVTATTPSPLTLDHRFHVYRDGSEIGIVDDGGTTTTTVGRTSVFRVAWDQTLAGAPVGPGWYVVQYRTPDGIVLEAGLGIDYVADFAVTSLAVYDKDPEATGSKVLVGCVRNDGVRPVPDVALSVSARTALAGAWLPQRDFTVRLDGGCSPGGSDFSLAYEPALTPGGFAVREVRVEANAARTVPEHDHADNARQAAARWLL